MWLLKGINKGVKCEMLFAEIKEAQYILTRILRTNGSGFIFKLKTPNKISKGALTMKDKKCHSCIHLEANSYCVHKDVIDSDTPTYIHFTGCGLIQIKGKENASK